MCGIAGIFGRTTGEFTTAFRAALNSQQHRGPDASGIYANTDLLLGHNHLRILDLTSAANQPMVSADGRYALVYNGEVFNHEQLRENYHIRSASTGDTAVVFQLLIQLGAQALPLLNGFFALAFYDQHKNELLLARDRFGEKPVWYTYQNQTLFFASELKALRRLGLEERINRESLHTYLRFTYIPAPNTIFEGIYKLQPGSYLLCTATDKKEVVWYRPTAPSIESFETLLDKAVERRLQADVPIGAFLSGGLDSSVVLALAKKHRPDITAYSLGFAEDKNSDETQAARETAQHLGVQHHILAATMGDLQGEWPFFVNALDEPFSDSSALAVSLLSKRMREHVAVALSGDGADEYLGGYRKHRAWMRMRQLSTAQKKIIDYTFKAIEKILPDPFLRSRPSYGAMKKFQAGLFLSSEELYEHWASWASEGELNALFPEREKVIYGRFESLKLIDWTQPNSILEADQAWVLPSDMLVKIDLMSMAHSLEVRSPFLDVHLVEKMRSLPAHEIFNARHGKLPLRAVAKKYLPETVLTRPKKGFEIPLHKWLMGSFNAEAKDRLAALKDSHLLDNGALDRLRQKLGEGIDFSAPLIFSLMVLHAWLEKNK